MEQRLEKLEFLRDFLALTSILLLIATSILVVSLIVVCGKIRTINRTEITETRDDFFKVTPVKTLEEAEEWSKRQLERKNENKQPE